MATRLVPSSSQAGRRVSTQPIHINSQHARPFSVQVALKGAQHTEPESSPQFADEGSKGFPV